MPPIRAGVPIIDRTTALHSAIGTLAALFERNISGVGQTIDVCLADSGYSLTEIPVSAYHGAGVEPKRGRAGSAPSGMYPCADGWVLISAGDDHMWPRVCAALGKPDWQEDPRFARRRDRGKNAAVDDKKRSGTAGHHDDEGRDRTLHASRCHRGTGEYDRRRQRRIRIRGSGARWWTSPISWRARSPCPATSGTSAARRSCGLHAPGRRAQRGGAGWASGLLRGRDREAVCGQRDSKSHHYDTLSG